MKSVATACVLSTEIMHHTSSIFCPIYFIFTDPCAVDNGGCDQVCAPGGNCLCTDGYTLDSDGKRCNGLFNV